MPPAPPPPDLDAALAALDVPAELHAEVISLPHVQRAVLMLDQIFGGVRDDLTRMGEVPTERHAINAQMLDDARRTEALHSAAGALIRRIVSDAEASLEAAGAFRHLPRAEAPPADPDPSVPDGPPPASPDAPTPPADPVEPEPEAPPETPLQGDAEAPARKRKGS